MPPAYVGVARRFVAGERHAERREHLRHRLRVARAIRSTRGLPVGARRRIGLHARDDLRRLGGDARARTRAPENSSFANRTTRIVRWAQRA